MNSLEKTFLSLIGAPLTDKEIELPRYSSEILRSAFNRALDQLLMVREKDPNVDPFSVFETAVILNLELERKSKSPVILICPHKTSFRTDKKSPYLILVVQPNIPKSHQCEERINQYGKLVVIKAEAIDELKKDMLLMLDEIKKKKFDFACFPELFLLNEDKIHETFSQLASENDSFIIAGSFHDEQKKSNTSVIFLPDGTSIKQNKIFRAEGEGILEKQTEILHIVDFSEAKFCVLICIDSEREAIREILKERLQRCKCPELIFNPSHTDHPQRATNLLVNSVMGLTFAAIVFCNTCQKGCSTVLAPFTNLKDKGFKLIELAASPETQMGEAQVDLLTIVGHKQTKRKCVISMIE